MIQEREPMPRKVRDSNLETRTARLRLKPGRKPYFRLIEPGLHIGYRRLITGPGTWVVRAYSGNGRYTVENLKTADNAAVFADDYSDADGVAVLAFGTAQERAKAFRPIGPSDHAGPFTVGDAMANYFKYLESQRKPTRTARSHDRLFIHPHFGETEVGKLTPSRLRDWLTSISTQAPRARTSKGKAQNFRVLDDSDEGARRRQATANRIWTTLKAGLNRAWRDGKVQSDAAWRRVEPFHAVDAARVRYLSIAECKRLINACPPDFRKLVQAALESGARYGQLARTVAADFIKHNGSLRLTTRKGRGREHVYHAVLNDEGARFFSHACAGVAASGLVFRKADGSAWNDTDQTRPMQDACERAKIEPSAGIHTLRHTWASHAVMNGVPLLVVAKNLGHRDTRMVERHYGHLAPTYIADAIRAGAPKFGFKATNVRAL
jgi:integrase